MPKLSNGVIALITAGALMVGSLIWITTSSTGSPISFDDNDRSSVSSTASTVVSGGGKKSRRRKSKRNIKKTKTKKYKHN